MLKKRITEICFFQNFAGVLVVTHLLIFPLRHWVYYHPLCICKYHFCHKIHLHIKVNYSESIRGKQELTIKRHRQYWAQDTLQRKHCFLCKTTQKTKMMSSMDLIKKNLSWSEVLSIFGHFRNFRISTLFHFVLKIVWTDH